jgi:hypothetical protein
LADIKNDINGEYLTWINPMARPNKVWLSISPLLGFLCFLLPQLCQADKTISVDHLETDYVIWLKFSDDKDAPIMTRTAARLLGKEARFARMDSIFDFTNPNYKIEQKIKLPSSITKFSSLDKLVRNSEGKLNNEGLRGQSTIEQKGSKGKLYKAVINAARDNVDFFEEGKLIKTEPIGSNNTDINSLPYFWFGSQVAAQDLQINVFDAKKVRPIDLTASEAFFKVGVEETSVVEFKTKNRKPGEAEIRVVVRKSDGFPLRFDLGLSERYGVSAAFVASRIPVIDY